MIHDHDHAESKIASRPGDPLRTGVRGFLCDRRQITGSIREYEQIEIYNVTNGERFTTYAIRAEDGSGIISVNGAAAHKANPGDIVIICAYIGLDQKELATFKPKLVYVNERNEITHTRNTIPVQVA